MFALLVLNSSFRAEFDNMCMGCPPDGAGGFSTFGSVLSECKNDRKENIVVNVLNAQWFGFLIDILILYYNKLNMMMCHRLDRVGRLFNISR